MNLVTTLGLFVATAIAETIGCYLPSLWPKDRAPFRRPGHGDDRAGPAGLRGENRGPWPVRHFEKIIQVQAESLRIYALSHRTDVQERDPARLPGAASGGILKLRPNVEENIAMARFANLLAQYTGDESHRALGAQAMRYLVIEEIATYRSTEPGILLADAELRGAPAHVTVIWLKGDAGARALHRAALRVPGVYRRIEWWDRSEGALPNADVAYPALDRPAAFFCAQGRCSLPVFTPGDLDTLAARLGGAASPMRASPR